MDTTRVSCGEGHVRVIGEMTVQHSAELKPLLLAAVPGRPGRIGLESAAVPDRPERMELEPAAVPVGGERIQLDLSGVTEIDTAGLQLLLMLQRQAALEVRPISIVRASAVVRRLLDLCRLTHLLGSCEERAQ